MPLPSIEGLAPASAGGRAVGLCLSSVLLTPSGSNRPTTFRTSTLSYPREPSTRAMRTKESPSPRRPCGRLRKFVGRSGLVVVSNPRRPPTGRGRDTQGDTGDAAQTAAENGSRSLQRSVRRLAVQAVPAGCRRVVSCPILDTAGLALRPPVGGFPAPLRAPAPRAGRRLFWAASLAPPTTKQEDQQ